MNTSFSLMNHEDTMECSIKTSAFRYKNSFINPLRISSGSYKIENARVFHGRRIINILQNDPEP